MHALTAPSAKKPLAWVQIPDRPLRRDEVRVQVHAASVNPVDWKMREMVFLGILQRLIGPRGPLVCGVDFAGEVQAVGAAITDLKVGDRVVGGTDFSRQQHGSYATQVQVRADQVAVLESGIDYAQAACLGVAGVTAQNSLLVHGRIDRKPASKVLILGAAGGVGHLAVQLARIHGATAVGVCSARNLDLVRSLGGIPLDYGQGDVLAAAAEHGPYDVIVDTVGTSSYPVSRCHALLQPQGVHVLVVPRAVDFGYILMPGPTVSVFGRPNRATLLPLVAHLAAGRLKVVIESRFPFEKAEQAQQVSRQGRVVGKLVLVADTRPE